MFNNPYSYNQQTNIDRINAQMSELERMKQQLQQPVQTPNINQTFQLAPTNRDVIKYASSIDEVQRDIVIGDTPYFSKDMSIVWIKNTKGEIKTYELNEIIPKDDKDIQIEMLQAQIDELKKGIKENEQYYSNVIAEQDETDTTTVDRTIREEFESNKSTGISKISKSKKK